MHLKHLFGQLNIFSFQLLILFMVLLHLFILLFHSTNDFLNLLFQPDVDLLHLRKFFPFVLNLPFQVLNFDVTLCIFEQFLDKLLVLYLLLMCLGLQIFNLSL